MKLAIIVIAQLVSLVTAEPAIYSTCQKLTCSPFKASDGSIYKNVHLCKKCSPAGTKTTESDPFERFKTHCVQVRKDNRDKGDLHVCVGSEEVRSGSPSRIRRPN
ncbi:hypothetical protein GcM1_195020 [Golovinomyces cichoracearum]|uniref:Secreted protein n=1 Tax=Golovinomyces cichoracearum TaxID=62708 RepID=A0A420J0E5_9PEZI|nr:hypothetical protein GcM1_195020 [Golovinomyces cichoracearum]